MCRLCHTKFDDDNATKFTKMQCVGCLYKTETMSDKYRKQNKLNKQFSLKKKPPPCRSTHKQLNIYINK